MILFRFTALCVLMVCGLLPATPCNAWQQDQDFFFDNIYVSEGLHYDPVYQILQDNAGLMWFGSSDGLHRYDGYRFVSYRNIPLDSTSLPHNTVRVVFKDRKGNLWVGTAKGGIALYQYPSDRFRRFKFRGMKAPYPAVEAIGESRDGMIWVGSSTHGLFYIDTASCEIVPCQRATQTVEPVHSIYHCRNRLYAGGTGALYLLKDKGIQTEFPVVFQDISYKNAVIRTMVMDGSGNLWIGTQTDGLFVFDPVHKRFIAHYSMATSAQRSLNRGNLPDDFITAGLLDRENRLWFATRENGLLIYDPVKKEFESVVRDEYLKGALSDNRCHSLFEDRTGIVWIGTQNGINKYDRLLRKFNYYYHHPLNLNSLSDNYIIAIMEDAQKRLWLGTRKGYVNIMDRQRNTCKRLLLKPGMEPNAALPYAFFRLDSLTMLISSDQGLYEYREGDKNISVHKPYLKSGIGVRKMRQMVRFKKHQLLMATENGVLIYDLLTRRFELAMLPGAKTGDAEVKTIYIDPYQQVWVSSAERLYQFDVNHQRFTEVQVPLDAESIDGLFTLCMLRQGEKLWLGTYNYGLILLHLDKITQNGQPEITRYTRVQGLPNEVIYCIMPDENNNFWLSTNKGVSCFNPKSNTFTNFDKHDGLQDDEFNRFAYFRSPSGEMFMGGINGLNTFFPSGIKLNPYPPEVVLTSLVLLNQSLSNDKLHPEIPLIERSDVQLDHHDNFIAIRFVAAHYSNPDKNEFYYQLENFDSDWIYAGTVNQITYTNLHPGEYTLRVRAVNPDGVPGKHHVSLRIYIGAPFWQKWWFIAMVFFILGGTAILLVQQRIREDRRIQKKLEAQIRERTREMVEQKEVIEVQNKILHDSKEQLLQLNNKKDVLLSVLSHDLRSPLTTLQGLMTILINYRDVFSAEELKMHAEKIQASVGHNLDLIDNVLLWAQSEMDRIAQKPVVLSLASVVDKTLKLYTPAAENKSIDLHSSIDPCICVLADENMMFVVVRNLVSNALKFTPQGGKISIYTEAEGGGINLVVKDSGVGLHQDMIDKLLQNNNIISTRGTSDEKGTGLGFSLCKKFVELNKGNIRIESKPGEGSVFIVHLPLAEEADSKLEVAKNYTN